MKSHGSQANELFSLSELEREWELAADWPEEMLMDEIEHMGETNPLLLAYLMEIGSETLAEEGQELLLFLGIFFLKLFYKKGLIPSIEVSEAMLQSTQEANEELLALMEEEPGKFEQNVSLLLEFHQYRIPLDFLGQILFEIDEAEELTEEMLWEIWIYLKIMMEAVQA